MTLGFEHLLVSMEQDAIGDYLKARLQSAPLETFIDFTMDE